MEGLLFVIYSMFGRPLESKPFWVSYMVCAAAAAAPAISAEIIIKAAIKAAFVNTTDVHLLLIRPSLMIRIRSPN